MQPKLKFPKKEKLVCMAANCTSTSVKKLGKLMDGSSTMYECQVCQHRFFIRAKEGRIKGTKKCKCNQGYIHRSRKEAGDCNKLHMMMRDPKYKIIRIEHEKQFPLRALNGTRIWYHKPDFLLTLEDGRQKVIETKGGQGNDVWKIKRKMFIDNYPDIEYEVWN